MAMTGDRPTGNLSRRGFLAGAAAVLPAAEALAGAIQGGPGDEAYWSRVAGLYDAPPKGVIQLENGQFGAMTRATRAAYERHILRINRETTLYTRSPAIGTDIGAVRAKVAALLGVDADEIAFTRGGTESMTTLIGQYNRLRPGDGILYADLDYDSMQVAMDSLARARGVTVTRIALPEPADRQSLIDAYDRALAANPKVRLMLLTQLSHRTGLMPPVAEIVAVAKARKVDVLLDSGHALGQSAFSLKGMGVAFAGLNLHKWIGAPLGVGVVYIRRDRLDAIDHSPLERPADRIDTRVHTGTVNYAGQLAVADAIQAHVAIGIDAKAARLRHLRARWVDAMRGRAGITILTPEDPILHAGITSFRIDGRTSLADNLAIKRRLREEFGIFTVERDGPAQGACVRVSPSFINDEGDVDALTRALDVIRRA